MKKSNKRCTVQKLVLYTGQTPFQIAPEEAPELPGFDVFLEQRMRITQDYLNVLLFELWGIEVWDRIKRKINCIFAYNVKIKYFTS